MVSLHASIVHKLYVKMLYMVKIVKMYVSFRTDYTERGKIPHRDKSVQLRRTEEIGLDPLYT